MLQKNTIVPFLRPKELAIDLATTEDTLKHALLEYERISKIKFDFCIFCHLQISSEINHGHLLQ